MTNFAFLHNRNCNSDDNSNNNTTRRDNYNSVDSCNNNNARSGGGSATSLSLSIFFATLCVIDLFGVFPIIALPSALISCGLYAIPLTIFVISIQIYTAVILGKCWIVAEKLDPSITNKNRYPYAAIADLCYGRSMSIFVTILLDLTVFGGGIPNLLVASQNLELLGLRISNDEFRFSFCYWLIIIGVVLCPIMWLGSPKNMKLLASISVCTVTSVALLTWYCILSDPVQSGSDKLLNSTTLTTEKYTFSNVFDVIRETEYPQLGSLLKAYGIIAFQFDIHPMLLTIQVDMRNKRGIGKSVSFGILFTITMSVVTTLLVLFRYGTQTTPNVLETPPRSLYLYVTILLVTLQLCLSSAVGSSALFQHIEDVFETSRHFTYKRCIIRSTLVCLAILLGELLPRFDLVMGLIGGSLTGPLIFILPPLFYTKIKNLEEEYDLEMARIKDQNDYLNIVDNELNDTGGNSMKDYGTMPLLIQVQRPRNGCTRLSSRILSVIRFICSDCLISTLVVVFGLCATFTSTYFNLFDITSTVQWSPCLSNATFNFLKF